MTDLSLRSNGFLARAVSLLLLWVSFWSWPWATAYADPDTFSGYVETQEEGTALTKRRKLNFIGTGVTCADNSANARTNCTFTGGGNSFETIDVPAGTDPVASSSTDTLTITESTFLTFTGTAATDTIDVTQVTTDLGTDGLIAANAVALGTDTTGNYAATIADAGNATITVANSGTETAAITLDAVDLNCSNCIGDTEVTTHAGTSLAADLEEEVTEGSLANDTIVEADLKAVDAAADENVLTYETTTGDFEWHTCAEITGGAGLCDGTDADSGGATAWSAIGDAAGAGAVAMAETVQTLDWDSAATAAAYDALTLTATHDSTSDADTQRLLVVERLASSGTAAFETLLQIQNNDTDGAVTNGIEILSAAGVITTALNLTDAEIATALAIGSNDITTGSTTISSAELDRLDGLTNTIVTDNTATTSIDGAGLSIASGTLNSDGFIIASGSTTGFSANFYCIPGGDCSTGSGSDDAWTFPMSGTLTNLYFFLKTAPGVGNSWDCSVVINNTASTNLTISTGNASGEFSDTSGSDSITAGDEFGFNCLETGTATGTSQVGFSVVFTPS